MFDEIIDRFQIGKGLCSRNRYLNALAASTEEQVRAAIRAALREV